MVRVILLSITRLVKSDRGKCHGVVYVSWCSIFGLRVPLLFKVERMVAHAIEASGRFDYAVNNVASRGSGLESLISPNARMLHWDIGE